MFVFLGLNYPAQYNFFKVHPSMYRLHVYISIHGWVIFHRVHRLHFFLINTSLYTTFFFWLEKKVENLYNCAFYYCKAEQRSQRSHCFSSYSREFAPKIVPLARNVVNVFVCLFVLILGFFWTWFTFNRHKSLSSYSFSICSWSWETQNVSVYLSLRERFFFWGRVLL